MVQIKTQSEQVSDTLEYTKPTSWSEATKTVRKFASEPLFIESLNNAGLSVAEQTKPEYSIVLSDYAKNYCDVYGKDKTIDKKLADQIMLVASAQYFL